MRQISDQQADLIEALILEKGFGDLRAAVLEKDIHVTDALHTLFDINISVLDFAFCGGTSLSKAANPA